MGVSGYATILLALLWSQKASQNLEVIESSFKVTLSISVAVQIVLKIVQESGASVQFAGVNEPCPDSDWTKLRES